MSEYRVERIDWEFNKDVSEKKNIARQARYKKGKRKKCNLTSDYLTKKQWKERCGKTVSYNFNKPIKWNDFCELPINVQKEYLQNLIQRFSTTATDLSKMLGVTPQTVVKRCNMEGIGISFSVGKRMTKEERIAFAEFCNADEVVVEEPIADEAVSDDTLVEEPGIMVIPNEAEYVKAPDPSQNMSMTEFSLSFAGGFDRDMIYNSIATILPAGTQVKMDIKCVVVM